MFDESSSLNVLDDTKPLVGTITDTENNGDFILYELTVYRGTNNENTWKVRHRYSDFASLHSVIQNWGISDLPFPKKKLFGNMDRAFVEDRRRALQMYLDVLLQNMMISESLAVKQFLDPEHYNDKFEEEALRQTSMFLRTEPHWKLIEPLNNIGYRLNRSYFLVNCETEVVGKQLLSWTELGPYYSFNGKEISSLTKTLTTIQHPYITPVTMSSFNQNGVHISRPFHSAGSLRDILHASKPKNTFFKKYLNQRTVLAEKEIATACRHVLEALVFLQDKGLPYGHLHTGNIMVDTTSNGNIYKISEVENFLMGLPSRYRNFHVQHGCVKTSLDADVYNFGLVLYEMATGAELPAPTTDVIPATVPTPLRNILESILSSAAQKEGMPTLDDLIADIYFSPTASSNHVQPILKLSSKQKQAISLANLRVETNLANDQKAVEAFRRQTKALQRNLSDDKKKRRKKPARENSTVGKDKVEVQAVTKDASIPPAPPPPAAPPAPPAAPAPPVLPSGTQSPLPKIEDVEITMFGQTYSYIPP